MNLQSWSIRDLAPGEGEIETVRAMPDDGWIPADAPGDTYLALHAAGHIPHPFAGQNEADCAWVIDREWWWRTTFGAEVAGVGERLILAFDGLDTYASVWLNGQPLGDTDNMFRTYRFDASDFLKDGVNDLVVRFTPPSVKVADKSMVTSDIIADPIKTSKRNFIRKAQFGWGWDWGPALPTVGLWRPVRLEREAIAVIDAVRFTTLSIGAEVHAGVEVSIDGFGAAEGLWLAVDLYSPEGAVVASSVVTAGSGAPLKIALTVADPQLWWTPELGDQPLYVLTTRLSQGDRELDRRTQRVGLRTVTLDQSPDPDEPGATFFRFVLNGVPIFARGANWIPASSFVGALTRQDYEPLVQAAADANMNMLRVWGGGIYEHDAFYDLCDEMGLLVWQDFMFACAPYPEDTADLVETIRVEVDQQIRRLRNHPCLALWCGENEGRAVHDFIDRMTGQKTPYPGDLYFSRMIPDALSRLDPATPYWPGSPSGGPAANSMRGGDVHNWTVWHGLPPVPDTVPVGGFEHGPEAVAYTRYAEDMARFVSEFGIQAAPSMKTLKRWLSPDQLMLGSEGFLNRIKDHPQDKVNAMLVSTTGLPTTLEEYVAFTQTVQADGLRFGIEHYRRRKPHCSGALLWQFNDCWPGISWSLIDHDGVKKPSWQAVADACAPLMASFKATAEGTVELWIVNDRLSEAPVELVVTLRSGAATVWTETVLVNAPSNAAASVWSRSAADLVAAGDLLTVDGDALPSNRYVLETGR
jgi:beta-mannosidase